MEEKILSEIKQIRKLLSELAGTSDLPVKQQFSRDAISKAAKEFRKLSIERGKWIPAYDVHKCFGSARGRTLLNRNSYINIKYKKVERLQCTMLIDGVNYVFTW